MDPAEVEVGQELPGKVIHVDRARLVDYAAVSGDHNRIHQDAAFARSVGLPDVIAHGMWTMGAAVDVVSQWVGDPTRVRSYRTRFTKPVVVPDGHGTDLEITGVVSALDRAAAQATVELTVTCDGVSVLSRTIAVVDLD